MLISSSPHCKTHCLYSSLTLAPRPLQMKYLLYTTNDICSFAPQVWPISDLLGPVHPLLRGLDWTCHMPGHTDPAPGDQSLWRVPLVRPRQHHHASRQCAIWYLPHGAYLIHAHSYLSVSVFLAMRQHLASREAKSRYVLFPSRCPCPPRRQSCICPVCKYDTLIGNLCSGLTQSRHRISAVPRTKRA